MTKLMKGMRNGVLAMCALTAIPSQGQAVLTYLSYANSIQIPVPTQAPTNTCVALAPNAPTTPLTVKKTFIENFDTLDLSSSKWTPHYDGGYDEATKTWLGYTWVVKRTQPAMHEQQLYVDPGYTGTTSSPLGFNPFIVDKGILHIVAQKTPANLVAALSGFQYTSGALTTRKSFTQRYGYFEARIQVPASQALLPAFWMLPINKVWPPELDIMEAPTQKKGIIQQTVHWTNAAGAATESACMTSFPTFSAGFHQYGALWTASRIVYYIDRVPVGQLITPPGMNLPMYMQINLAVGGDWVGAATAATPIPVEMLVDSVVAYSEAGPAECVVLANGVTQCPAK